MARGRRATACGAAAWAAAALACGLAEAGPAEEGRATYLQICGRCHGQIDERSAAADSAGRLLPAVMAPIGPNLTGIYGRPAGAVPGFHYSKAFRAATEGLVWDADSLDRWLADSQAFARGSYMFQKTAEPERGRIIAYLARYSRHAE